MRTLFIAFSIAALPAAAQLVRGEYPETRRSLEFHLNELASDAMGGAFREPNKATAPPSTSKPSSKKHD